ncbi:MAG: choice-of-anchor tandem repeat GloVer-containing protein [Terriglobales bacterium]
MNSRFICRACAALALASVLANASWAATYKKLYNFTGGTDGGDPATPLTFDSAGNAYGTTAAGGDFDFGTVFMLTPAGQETVLYSFTGAGDGLDPHGGVTLDSAGNLFGTTVAGGFGGICAGDGCGVVFELTPSGGSWTETTLYSFQGLNDGFGPGGGLVFDTAGNLFGTTPDGGAHSAGVVFELSPTKHGWRYKVIHAFTGGKDGAVGSLGLLLFDAAGNLYGVTEIGGTNGAGAVYKLSPTPGGGWKTTVLYDFKGMPDAANPYGGLIFDELGNLYGTTYFGGATGMGAVFQLIPGPNGTWQENVLYSFQGGTDGSFPTTTLVFNAAKSLYGTTSTGGRPSCDCGTVFKLTLSHGSWNEKIVHLFGKGRDGSSPNYGLTLDQAGNLYGTTPVGGTGGQGMVFQLTP